MNRRAQRQRDTAAILNRVAEQLEEAIADGRPLLAGDDEVALIRDLSERLERIIEREEFDDV